MKKSEKEPGAQGYGTYRLVNEGNEAGDLLAEGRRGLQGQGERTSRKRSSECMAK